MRRLGSLLVLLAATLAACSAGPQSTAPMRPSIPLSESPSGLLDGKSTALTFCADPPHDQPVSLTNAAWLSFIAANEYTHANAFGPMLNDLGFANPDVPRDRQWSRCTSDLRELRKAQVGHEAELRAFLSSPKMKDAALGHLPRTDEWGACARDYVNGDGFDPNVLPAAGFQRDLVQHVHNGSYLEFFSGGTIDRNGNAFTDESTQVVFARNHDMPLVIISFRGTETKEWGDLAADLKVWKKPLQKDGWPEAWGDVHAGFLDAFEEVEPLLMLKLRELDGSHVPIWVTGHSLGGALATLAAARILRAEDEGLGVDLRGVYTFGSPRVGDRAFAAAFAEKVKHRGVSAVRVRNANDVVTSIPGMVLEYEHVGLLAYLQEGALEIRPDADVPYDGPSLGDHSSSGFGGHGEPVSGYYRRIAGLLQGKRFPELSVCAVP